MGKRNNGNNHVEPFVVGHEVFCPICGGNSFLWKCVSCGWEGPEYKLEEENPSSRRQNKKKKREYTIRSDT